MTQPPLHGRYILIAEDEFLLADDLAQLLKSEGAVVVGPVASVAAALSLIEGQTRIDLALLDVNLGGDMAFPVGDALIERDIPFAFTTGYDAVPARFAAIPRLEKPFCVGLVSEFLKRLL